MSTSCIHWFTSLMTVGYLSFSNLFQKAFTIGLSILWRLLLLIVRAIYNRFHVQLASLSIDRSFRSPMYPLPAVLKRSDTRDGQAIRSTRGTDSIRIFPCVNKMCLLTHFFEGHCVFSLSFSSLFSVETAVIHISAIYRSRCLYFIFNSILPL
jgi:hypothetical protein